MFGTDYCTVTCFGMIAISSADDLDVTVTCPASVTSGTALYVNVTPNNNSCSDTYTLSRAMLGVVGNSGSTLASAGIWCPYNKTFSSWSVPAATSSCSPDCCVSAPGSGGTRTIKVIDSVPASLSGTVAMATVEFLSSSAETLGGGSCMVTVVP